MSIPRTLWLRRARAPSPPPFIIPPSYLSQHVLGTFDGTRDGRRWGGLAVELTDRAPADCAAYHYAARRCMVGAAQARFTAAASGLSSP